MKKIFIAIFFSSLTTFAQDDLLNELDTNSDDQEVISAFKSVKIVNLESTKLVAKGDLFFVVAHRFDYINTGIDEFFGLDNANTQLKFIYGLSENIAIQLGRSSLQKTIDMGIKYNIIKQRNNGSPVAIVGFNSLAINTQMKKAQFPNLVFDNRLSFVNQLLISRKFSDKFTFQLAPTHFHENTVIIDEQNNSQFSLGLGGRYKLTNRLSLNLDYAAHLNRAQSSTFKNPLSIGLDLETGGHVFQLHFTNARAMHESGFLGQTSGDFFKGDIAFGFNLVRVF